MAMTMPEAARPPLRVIASAVVQEAQRSYREHLHQPDPTPQSSPLPDSVETHERARVAGGPSITGDWPLILRTVNDVLADEPRRRDDLLLHLANAFK